MKKQDRVNEILQEIRIVLPGTQALLGFQFIAFFNSSFKELSSSLQAYHLINLVLTTFSVILLITPVAYQEIRENGRNTERWLRFTSKIITVAMLCLLAGLAGDIFIAGNLLQLNSNVLAWIASVFTLSFGMVMWFGITSLKRRNR
jgi:hypothetical protein